MIDSFGPDDIFGRIIYLPLQAGKKAYQTFASLGGILRQGLKWMIIVADLFTSRLISDPGVG
jgi:hypothetical protein